MDVFDSQLKQHTIQQDCIPLTSLAGYDEDDDTDALIRKGGVRAPGMFTTRTIESEVIDNILIQAAMSQLKEPLRSAYLLRHYYGWQIENQDPNVQTISWRFNKTPRTIRNWLNKAEKCLEAWREENRDE